MEIKLQEITIRDLFDGYVNDEENGVVAYGGKLNVRPKYQREFIYKDEQRNAVIETIKKNFPLNTMYWCKNEDGNFELLDGQQRTLSICQYLNGDFSLNYQFIHNLEDDEKEQILNYKLMIYICEGTNSEKLDWFKIINIAGEKLTPQELRNAVYTGEWLTDAKKYFSKTQCPVYHIAKDYLTGSSIRQEYLETALKWICNGEMDIEDYMALHQHDQNAGELWLYFNNVINWVKVVFPKYRKEMKGLAWGLLYNKFKNKQIDTAKFEARITELMSDDDVTNKKGIYEYLLDGEEKHLSIRLFTDTMKRGAYERQNGICPKCGKHFQIQEMQGDHITPWSQGGKTVTENCQMLCIDCNRRKSDK